MPVSKSAAKALRKDKRRTAMNKPVRSKLKNAVDAASKAKSETALSAAFSAIDRAAKKRVIHRNKAARLKSKLSKLLSK